MIRLLLPIILLASASRTATPLPDIVSEAVARALAEAGFGTRVGLLVTDERGRALVWLRADERFVPASNTKLFTTAAAFAMLDVADPVSLVLMYVRFPLWPRTSPIFCPRAVLMFVTKPAASGGARSPAIATDIRLQRVSAMQREQLPRAPIAATPRRP